MLGFPAEVSVELIVALRTRRYATETLYVVATSSRWLATSQEAGLRGLIARVSHQSAPCFQWFWYTPLVDAL